jgi:protein-S-isoprenylcysteine O-methyltransferase Ste14
MAVEQRPRYFPRLVPPVYWLAALGVMALLHRHAPGPRWLPAPWNLAGLAFVFAGGVLGAWSLGLFVRWHTSFEPLMRPEHLVTDGPYRFSRNPMYLGLALMLLGVALLLGTLTPLLGVPLFMLAVELVFIRPEERLLAESAGPAYDAYRRRVRRWL